MKIEKSKLITFIKKYNLNKICESVGLTADAASSTLVATFYDHVDRAVLGKVTMANFKTDKNRTIGIFDTAKLLKQLSPLEEGELDLDFVETEESNGEMRVTKLVFKDSSNYKQEFPTADLSTIKSVPSIKKIPNFNVEMKVSKIFASKFGKFKSALSDIKTFSLVPGDGGKPSMYLGYAENINTNSTQLPLKLESGKDTIEKVVMFNAIAFDEIFSANSEAFVKDDTELTFYLTDAGFSTITFDVGDFKCEYFLPAAKNS